MRIAVVHSFYRSDQPSGENTTVLEQVATLTERGHEVQLVRADSDNLDSSLRAKMRLAFTVANGKGQDPTEALQAFAPDVVHIHNLFPNFGTDWLSAYPGPVLTTVHNFRSVCASGTLWRDGQECTLCPSSTSAAAVRHACYRDSRAATLPLAIRMRGGPMSDPVLRRADLVVALTRQVMRTFAQWRTDLDKWRLLPNPVSDRFNDRRPEPEQQWLYAGRLSSEKGLLELVRAWPEHEVLRVAGSGPMQAQATRESPASVAWLGVLDPLALAREYEKANALILPSLSMEGGYALSAVEALAAGCPVIASRGNVMADLVERYNAGVALDLRAGSAAVENALATVRRTPSMRENARRAYLENFSRDAWLARYEDIANECIRLRGERLA